MSKKRTIQRKIVDNATRPAAPQVAPARRAFSITLAFDPVRPGATSMNVMPVGGDGNSQVLLDDVVTALRMGYEQTLIQIGARLLRQQMAAQQTSEDIADKGSAPAT